MDMILYKDENCHIVFNDNSHELKQHNFSTIAQCKMNFQKPKLLANGEYHSCRNFKNLGTIHKIVYS